MDFAARDEYSRARTRLDFVRTDLNPQEAFENIPGLVVTVVNVARSDEPRWSRRAARIPPLGDHECIVDCANDLSREQWSNDRRTHRADDSKVDPGLGIPA